MNKKMHRLNQYLKIFVLSFFVILFPSFSEASYDSAIVKGDVLIRNVKGVNIVSDLIITSYTMTTKWSIDNGLFTVILQEGSVFRFKSTNINVKSILYKQGNTEFCTTNIKPGVTEAVLSIPGNYIVQPQAIECPSIPFITLDTQASPAPQAGIDSVVSSYQAIAAPDPKKTILYSQPISIIKEVVTEISEAVVQELSKMYNSTNMEVYLKLDKANGAGISKEIKADPQTKKLIDQNIFGLYISVNGNNVLKLNSSIMLSFDVSQIAPNEDLRVVYFNREKGIWEMAGNGGIIKDGKLIVYFDYLNYFGIMNFPGISKIVSHQVTKIEINKVVDSRDIKVIAPVKKNNFIEEEKIKAIKIDAQLAKKLSGFILLQVELAGEAWYVYPVNNKKYYLGRPMDAFNVMRKLGLGIKHDQLSIYLKNKFPVKLSGRILLDVEKNGEAYYINPKNLKGYYLNRPADAFGIMRSLGVGIANVNIRKIEVGE